METEDGGSPALSWWQPPSHATFDPHTDVLRQDALTFPLLLVFLPNSSQKSKCCVNIPLPLLLLSENMVQQLISGWRCRRGLLMKPKRSDDSVFSSSPRPQTCADCCVCRSRYKTSQGERRVVVLPCVSAPLRPVPVQTGSFTHCN